MDQPTLARLEADFKEAMKSKDEIGLSTLRMVRTALKNKQIELQHELTEPEVGLVLKTMIKQYQDAVADFNRAGRLDLVERQQKEIDIIAKYLPPALPADELEKIVAEAVKASGATEVGKAMGAAMQAVAGRADGNAVRVIVQKLLSG
jgi:uncharacterized protein YqeY